MPDPLLSSKERAERDAETLPYIWGAVILAVLLVAVVATFGYLSAHP